jgi:hypothetical protein
MTIFLRSESRPDFKKYDGAANLWVCSRTANNFFIMKVSKESATNTGNTTMPILKFIPKGRFYYGGCEEYGDTKRYHHVDH